MVGFVIGSGLTAGRLSERPAVCTARARNHSGRWVVRAEATPEPAKGPEFNLFGDGKESSSWAPGKTAEKVKELLGMLDNPDPTVRLRAVIATKELSNEEAEPVLSKVFDSGEKELQNLYFATLALGYKPNSRSYDLLMELVDSGQDPEIRANALAALGYLGDSRAVPVLVRAIYEETHWTAKTSAAVSLGSFRDPRCYDALIDGLSMDEAMVDDMKIGCIGSLGELGDVRCLEHILPSATSNNFILRQVVAEALGNLNSEQSVGALKTLACDSHDNVSTAAEKSLERLSGLRS